MNSNNLALVFVICTLLISCKGDNKKPENTNSDPDIERLKNLGDDDNKANLASQRSQALSILNYRLKDNPEPYAIVEADLWEYEFVFDGQMSKPGEYEGVWIDFKPDFTYEYGRNSEVLGSGRYHYHFDRGELLMVDNQSDLKPREWSVKSAGDAMVLIGTRTYGDNSIQMKLVRKPDSLRQPS